jgi:hypothetical protein
VLFRSGKGGDGGPPGGGGGSANQAPWGGTGASGEVRIMWGLGRSYPVTSAIDIL